MTFRLDISPLTFQKIGLMPDPEKERRDREKRLAGALSPQDMGTAAPVAGDPMVDLGQPAGPQSTPVQGEMAQIGQNIRRPETVQDLLAGGYSPSSIIELFQALPPEQQPDFQRFYEGQKQDYILRGKDYVQPALVPLIENDLKITKDKPFDPTSISSLPEARIRAAQGLLDKGELAKMEANQPPPDPFDEYGSIKSRADAQRARINNKISPERLAEYEKIYPEEAPKAGTSPEDQFMADVKAILPSIEKEKIGKDANGQDVLIPLTFDERMQKAVKKAGDLRGMARNAGVVQGPPVPGPRAAAPAATPAAPAEDTSAAAWDYQPEDTLTDTERDQAVGTAAAEMEAAGVTDIDTSDPQFLDVYHAWKDSQDASLR